MIDTWVDGWVDARIAGCMYRWLDVSPCARIDARAHGCIDVWAHVRMDGLGGLVAKWMDVWVNDHE